MLFNTLQCRTGQICDLYCWRLWWYSHLLWYIGQPQTCALNSVLALIKWFMFLSLPSIFCLVHLSLSFPAHLSFPLSFSLPTFPTLIGFSFYHNMIFWYWMVYLDMKSKDNRLYNSRKWSKIIIICYTFLYILNRVLCWWKQKSISTFTQTSNRYPYLLLQLWHSS